MLLKSTGELKTYFSNIHKDYNFNSITSFVIDAESEYIIPAVGRSMYDKLSAAYNADGKPDLIGKLKTALEIAQKAVTHLALYFSADSGSFHISDSGFYVVSATDSKPVSDKKIVVFREGRIASGLKAVDELIDYLEQNIDDPAFADYKGSYERSECGSHFISNARVFTKYFSPLKGSGLTFRMMFSSLANVEEVYITPILGEELFEELKDKLINGQLDEKQKKLIEKLQKPLALLTVAEAIPVIPFNFDGQALTFRTWVSNNENIEALQTPNESRLSTLMNSCLQNGQEQLSRLRKFLNKNAADYPLYKVVENIDELNPNCKNYGIHFV